MRKASIRKVPNWFITFSFSLLIIQTNLSSGEYLSKYLFSSPVDEKNHGKVYMAKWGNPKYRTDPNWQHWHELTRTDTNWHSNIHKYGVICVCSWLRILFCYITSIILSDFRFTIAWIVNLKFRVTSSIYITISDDNCSIISVHKCIN